LFHAAELTAGGVARFLRGHATLNVFFCESFEVRPKFGVEFGFAPAFAKQAFDSKNQNAQPSHVCTPRWPCVGLLA
jgi:hypothetical protein